MANDTAAAINAVSQQVQNATNAYVNTAGKKSQANRAFRLNKRMAEYQYGKDLESWERQNEYNLPANQMQRFEDAGLNKNLMFGQGSSGNATQMPKYSDVRKKAADIQATPPMNTLGQYQDARQKSSQLDTMRVQRDNIKMDTINKVSDNILKRWNVEGTKQAISHKQGLYPGQLSMQEAEILKKNQETANILATKLGTEAKTEFQGELNRLAKNNQFVGDDWKRSLFRDAKSSWRTSKINPQNWKTPSFENSFNNQYKK